VAVVVRSGDAFNGWGYRCISLLHAAQGIPLSIHEGVAVCCCVLLCVAVWCSAVLHAAQGTTLSIHEGVAACCSVLQRVAALCYMHHKESH